MDCAGPKDSGSFARIGLMCHGNAGQYFGRFLERVGDRCGVPPDCRKAPRQRILPLSPIRKTYAERLLVVGDAARLVKPTTGGGIYYSIVSADIAADVLARAVERDDLSETALAEYERRWRERLTEEFNAQLTLRLLAERLSDAQIEDLFELARVNGVLPLVRKTARFNQHRDLIAALLKHPAARKILLIHFSETHDEQRKREIASLRIDKTPADAADAARVPGDGLPSSVLSRPSPSGSGFSGIRSAARPSAPSRARSRS